MIILTAKQYHNHPSPGPDSFSPPKNSFILIPVDTRKLAMRFILPKHELLEHPAASHPTTDHSVFTDDPQHNTNAEFLNDRNVDNVRDSEVDNEVGGEVGVAAWVETTRCYMYSVIDMYSISIQHCYITKSSKLDNYGIIATAILELSTVARGLLYPITLWSQQRFIVTAIVSNFTAIQYNNH
jgi:hypothetical protein